MLLVTNGRVITRDAGNAYLENGAVAIDGERIAEVGPAAALAQKYPDAEVVDAHGGVIMLLMAAYALPRLEMHAWAAGAGEGFTLRITPTLWMREPVAEFAGVVPQPAGEAGQA